MAIYKSKMDKCGIEQPSTAGRKKMKYTKPSFELWTAEELDNIEAQMSGGGSPVSPPVWTPPVEVLSASYDGEYLTVRYKVNRNRDSRIQIGYEYAISLGLNAYNPEYGVNISNSIGTHTVNIPVINYMCEIRVCIRVVSGYGDVVSVDRTNIIMYNAPSGHNEAYSEVTLADAIIWKGFWFGISLTVSKYASTVIKILWEIAEDILEVNGLFDSKFIDVPQVQVGQLYRTDWYYVGREVHLKLDIWNAASDHYTYNLAPDFSYHHVGSIASF